MIAMPRAARALIAGLSLMAMARIAMSQQPAGSGAIEGFEHVLPKDTVLFIGSDDIDAAGRNLRATAYGTWWHDPANAELRDALADVVSALGEEATAQLGVNPLALPAMAHGRLAFAVAGDLVAAASEKTPRGVVIALLADVGADHEACDAIVAGLEDKLEAEGRTARKIEDIDGTEVTVLEDASTSSGKPVGRMRVAFHGDTLIVLLEFLPVERDVMAAILGGLAGEPTASLADLPRFRESLAAQPGDVQLWLDAGAIASLARAAIEMKDETKADEDAEQDDSTPEETLDMVQRLGLFDVGALSMSMRWTGEGSRLQARLDWAGDGWIPSLARCLLGPGDAGMLAAAPGSAIAAGAAHIDFGGLMDQILKVVVQTGKATSAEVAETLSRMHEGLGFDLREDLLGALDGRLGAYVFHVPPEDAVPIPTPFPINEVIQFGLRDGEALNSLIEDFVRRSGAQAARQRDELLGFEVFHYPLGPDFTAHYAILPDTLIVSFSETLMVDALRRRAGGTSQPVLAADSVFAARIKQLEMPAWLMHYGIASLGLLIAADAADGARSALVKRLTDPKSADTARRIGQRLGDLPDVDPAVLSKYFDGGMLTTLTMDERGLLFQSASP